MSTLNDFKARYQGLTKGKYLVKVLIITELMDIQMNQSWFNLNLTTEKCLEFLSTLYDSPLMKEYNVSSMNIGYGIRRDGVDPPSKIDQPSSKNEIERRRFKELYTKYENKVEELKKQHQTNLVSALLLPALALIPLISTVSSSDYF